MHCRSHPRDRAAYDSRRHPGLRLHTNQISAQEITYYDTLPVTTVARTIADVALAGLADELVEQAVREAVHNGLVTPALLLAAASPADRG